MWDQQERLISAKGWNVATQGEYEEILDEIANLRLEKVHQRGESRYNERDTQLSKLLLLADLHRKYQRVARYLRGEGGTQDLEDDFKDLANYAIMGVQLMRREEWR